MTRKNVLVFRPLPTDQLARLQAVHTVTVADPRQPAERAAFDAALAEAHGLIGSSFPITPDVLARAPQLQVISSISVGVDNYPVQALHDRGITLCHTPGVLDETVADAVFALLMATCRRVPELAQMVREGRWTRNIGEELFGVDVHGKTLGLLGFGRIGQAVARRAALGFGMPVLYHARNPVDLATHAPELHDRAEHVLLAQLLARSDIVVALLPLSDSTRGLVKASVFAAMNPGAIVITTGAAPQWLKTTCWRRLTAARCVQQGWMCLPSSPCRCRRPCVPTRVSRHCPISARPPTTHGMPWQRWPPPICCRRWLVGGPLPCMRPRAQAHEKTPLCAGGCGFQSVCGGTCDHTCYDAC